uniref:Conserved oligomeric Golgi complex subunit 3 C-terminal domain-containing protein n=1 Tax=Gossypium raimondii TaxID=29730 RepID=A0A0D2QNW5_GOSRA|nr:hypothetical protein B456_004G136800 [Gossypium raimondii]
MVDILKVEVLEEQLSRKSESLAGLRPSLERILADIHERLTFRARTYIRDEIANYIPINEDLNYPAKLEHSADVVSETATMESYFPASQFRPSSLEKLLKDHAGKYMTGDEVSMADLFLAPQILAGIERFNVDMETRRAWLMLLKKGLIYANKY